MRHLFHQGMAAGTSADRKPRQCLVKNDVTRRRANSHRILFVVEADQTGKNRISE
jgi:hypothetical protein